MAILTNAGTYSSNGVETSPSENFVIDFKNPVNSLVFTAKFNDLNLKINGEPNFHFIENGDSLQVEGIYIDKITIKESGVKYTYHALFY